MLVNMRFSAANRATRPIVHRKKSRRQDSRCCHCVLTISCFLTSARTETLILAFGALVSSYCYRLLSFEVVYEEQYPLYYEVQSNNPRKQIFEDYDKYTEDYRH
jgi:hypothetical protein